MIEQKLSTIQEAPSLDDITSAGERVGRVDFSTQLGAEEPEPGHAEVSSLSALAGPHRPPTTGSTTGRPTGSSARRPTAGVDAGSSTPMPMILPPAKVDEAMAAQVAQERRMIAEARGEVFTDATLEADQDEDGDAYADEDEDGVTTESGPAADSETVMAPAHAATPVPQVIAAEPEMPEDLTPALSRRERRRLRKPQVEAPEEPVAVGPTGEGLLIQDVASLSQIAADAAARATAKTEAAKAAEHVAAERRREAEATEAQALSHLGATTVQAPPTPLEEFVELPPTDLEDLDEVDDLVVGSPAGRLHDVGPGQAEVAEVAASVIAMMQATEKAHQRHIEAIELETARRCELLTAQAELDAELIRLHARREAHTIIAAAHTRTVGPPIGDESDQLSEIGETFSRFAESIETTMAAGQESPDHLRKS